VIRPGASTTRGGFDPTTTVDAKPPRRSLSWVAAELPHLCPKGLRRDDSVAFMDVFWPCESALLAALLSSMERNSKTSPCWQCVYTERDFFWEWVAQQLLAVPADIDSGHIEDGAD
jgi:hypothetical protein